MSKDQAHRAELTKAERADQVARWIQLVEERQERENQMRQVDAPESDVGYKKPPEQVERGTRAASRELGISEPQAERADQVARWIRLVEEKQEQERVKSAADQSGQVGPNESKREDGKGHRKESGVNAASRELDIPESTAKRAVKIASISDDAKQAAKDAGLDDNQSALERIAKADDQVAEVGEIASEREDRERQRENAMRCVRRF
ncbi:MAG: hypothetical protein FKY71_18670 [Spiribacter salinus]|uniref:Uncharacterized protein n=1 Tax=Spiribacter salinus TaxID=1335746 RepID=A0A540V849_9GAMM|nr:MAG: hypothetical protein FKY71_18670 [Spiribacter salinus]